MESGHEVTPANRSLTRTALLLAGAGIVALVVLSATDHDGAGWILMPVLGLAAAVTAWRAGGSSPRNLPAFIALIIGAILTLMFLGWVIFGE